jgi:phenylalanyl-tRNA synthetase beta chain
LDAALPQQPRHAAVVLSGTRAGRPVETGDAVEVCVRVAELLGAHLAVQRDDVPPFHPGRCAALVLAGTTIGHAGELHPRVITALELPPRTVAAELDLDALVSAAEAAGPVLAPLVSAYPPSTVDVALVVADEVLAGDVESALAEGAGELLEQIRLFDVYTGPQVGEGRRSLAFTLRFRAPDRTLTDAEVLAARDAAVALAAQRTGATLRS